MEKKKFFDNLGNVYTIAGLFALIVGFVLIMIPTLPYIWYTLYPTATEHEVERIYEKIVREDQEGELVERVEEEEEEEIISRLPEKNPDLPNEPYIVIEKIDVYSPIERGEDYISILTRGTWMVPEFGDPINNDTTIILAAHRFGYSYWTREERNRISFYNLPSIDVGDQVKIIWDQREFTYEIYKAEESNYITDYDADLIIYTCKFFNSPVRIFRYARAIY